MPRIFTPADREKLAAAIDKTRRTLAAHRDARAELDDLSRELRAKRARYLLGRRARRDARRAMREAGR